MRKEQNYSKKTLIVLVLLRLILGYHFLFEGVDKLFNPHWTSAGFLLQANWLFSGFFHSLAENPTILIIVDNINIWGQILIGISLIIGLFSVSSAVAGAVMLAFYYIAVPPFMANQIFVDKNLLEFFAFLIITLFPTSNILGFDSLIKKERGAENAR